MTFKYCGFLSVWQKQNNGSRAPNYKSINKNEERDHLQPQREVRVFKENAMNGFNNKVTSTQGNTQVKHNWDNSEDSSDNKAITLFQECKLQITLVFLLIILVTRLPRPYDKGCRMKKSMIIYCIVRWRTMKHEPLHYRSLSPK